MLIMEIDNDDDSDEKKLIIDETIILSSDEDDRNSNIEVNRVPILSDTNLLQQDLLKKNVEDKLYRNLFHPLSITSSDLKDELFLEETNTCNICHESFRYNIGLIYHLEMEHVSKSVNEEKRNKKLGVKKSQTSHISKKSMFESKKVPKKLSNKNSENNSKLSPKVTTKKSCENCKKIFSDDKKYSKHAEQCCTNKFHCVYCKLKFGWESKYKKHLFKNHKLNAAVICKLCSSVFSDMTSLADHKQKCPESYDSNKQNEDAFASEATETSN